jgi:hypothetical protein
MNGEGFAYFRWHSLMWPDIVSCRHCENYVCAGIWGGMR